MRKVIILTALLLVPAAAGCLEAPTAVEAAGAANDETPPSPPKQFRFNLTPDAAAAGVLIHVGEDDWVRDGDGYWARVRYETSETDEPRLRVRAGWLLEDGELRYTGSGLSMGQRGGGGSGWYAQEPRSFSYLMFVTVEDPAEPVEVRVGMVDSFMDELPDDLPFQAPLVTAPEAHVSLYWHWAHTFSILPGYEPVHLERAVEVEDSRPQPHGAASGPGDLSVEVRQQPDGPALWNSLTLSHADAGAGFWEYEQRVDGTPTSLSGAAADTPSLFLGPLFGGSGPVSESIELDFRYESSARAFEDTLVQSIAFPFDAAAHGYSVQARDPRVWSPVPVTLSTDHGWLAVDDDGTVRTGTEGVPFAIGRL